MSAKKLLLCDCLKSQTIDRDALQNATGISCSTVYSHLCGSQAGLAHKAIQDGNLIIACQQERHFFEEEAASLDVVPPSFVDLRDRAGWTDDTGNTTPKMAALIADVMLPQTEIKTVDVESAGLCLIIGKPAIALRAAQQLCQILNVTILLEPGEDPGIFDDRNFDIVRGRLSKVTGTFGKFEVRIDAFEEAQLAGRGDPGFGSSKDGAGSFCDIILDLSGKAPLFSAHEHRDGYLRADPDSFDAQLTAILQASQYTGTFEKPLYVSLETPLCAHSRAGKTGCTRCLDICPTGAITPAGDHIAIDPMICAGCGACSAICPSGAISYDVPAPSDVFKRIETLAAAWHSLSKKLPILLVHEVKFGAEMIRLSSRYGKGLPADVIPMEVSALAAFGHAEMLAALACGFSTVTILLSPKSETDGLPFEAELACAIAGADRIKLAEPADPDDFDILMWSEGIKPSSVDPILPLGARREITRLAAKALNPETSIIPLPPRSPYGTVKLDKSACTLCLSCVSLCPSGALAENPDLPQIRFQEDACLQCGICTSICPESAIALEPQLNLSDEALAQQVLHEEEPFACIECGTLFGVRSTILRISEKLAGKHSMFSDASASKMIQMCDNCRVNAAYHSQDNPFAQGTVPKPRTTDDYH